MKGLHPNQKQILTVLTVILAFILCETASAAEFEQNYTFDEDFDEGTMVGLEHNSTNNQIQLSNGSQSALPYIWVPNSNQGTVSKINTITGMEIARYRTGPQSSTNPSRTTVDLEGNCWLGNRQTGTAVKIGLLENSCYTDRNQNGVADTCRDLDGNGIITADEILPWGQDECVLYEVILIPGHEGTYDPGNYTGPYVNDNNNPGPRGIAVDSKNNVWLGTYGSKKYYHVDGKTGQIMNTVDLSSVGHTPYGAVIDQNGILWSSGAGGQNLLRLDTSNNSITTIRLKHFVYGLGLDRNNHLFVAGWDSSCFSRINILTGKVEWTKPCPYQSRGVAVTDDGDVWIANSAAGTVTRYSNNGDFKATVIVGATPTGVSVDNQGKVWVVDYGDEYVHRINPSNNQKDSVGNIINGVELSKKIIGGTHYGYSDMTGTISNTITTNKGTWTVVHDSGLQNSQWGLVSWTCFEPAGTRVTVRTRSSNDRTNWSNWETVQNGFHLNSTPKGRYLEIETELIRLTGYESPILYDLMVRTIRSDVKMETTLNNSNPSVGDNVKIITKLINNGPDAAHNLLVHLNLPPGFIWPINSQGFIDGSDWAIGTLNPGESAYIEINGTITPEMAGKNLIYNLNETHDEYDPLPNSELSGSIYIPLFNLEVNNNTKNGVHTLTVHNNGLDTAFNLAVPVKIPQGSTPRPSQGYYQNGSWYIGFIAPGSTTLFSLSFPALPPLNQINYNIKVENKAYAVTTHNYFSGSGDMPPPKHNTIPMESTGIYLNFSAIAILLVFLGSYINLKRDNVKPNKLVVFLTVLGMVLLFMGSVSATGENRTYNTTSDFKDGVFNNINCSDNNLKLDNQVNLSKKYLWVPNTNQGTVSKIDVLTGQEVARYRTSPQENAFPFRTAADDQGNCWVSNKITGTLVKIGSYENGNYRDRNHNGAIETCHDKDGNGVITSDELLPWGSDECVLYEVVLTSETQGTYIPGDYRGSYANYANGIKALTIDSQNNLWVGSSETNRYYCIDNENGQILKVIDVSKVNHSPSYVLMDKIGILWSGGNNLLRLDPSTETMKVFDVGCPIYSMALDDDNHLFLYEIYNHWLWPETKLARFDTTTNTVNWTKSLSYMYEGSILVSHDGSLWVADYYNHWFNGKREGVTRYSSDGEVLARIITPSLPLGLSEDVNGKIWVLESSGEYIHRIDPEINGVDLSKRVVGGVHDALGSMTAPNNGIYDQGTWTVVHDSGFENACWGRVTWTCYEPLGTLLTVKVRSSNDQSNWSQWENVQNGVKTQLTPKGRYLEVSMCLERFNALESPVVYSLSVRNLNESGTDLMVNMIVNKTVLDLGETVLLTIQTWNKGPKTADVTVKYITPSNLKLLISNGPGTYYTLSGIWNVGTLPAGGTAVLELVLQAVQWGSSSTVAVVSSNFQDLNPLDNVVQIDFSVTQNVVDGPLNVLTVDPLFNTEAPEVSGDESSGGTGGDSSGGSNGVSNPPVLGGGQLARDIRGVRNAVSSGTTNGNIPEWNPEPLKTSEPSDEELKEWESLLIGFGAEIVFGLIPDEYLQMVQSASIKAASTFNQLLRSLGFVKQSNQIAQILKRSHQILQTTAVGKWVNRLSAVMSGVGPNVGMKILGRGLCKMFPKAATEIKIFLATLSIVQFFKDPLGTLNAIINAGTAIFKKETPDPEDLAKFLIAGPVKETTDKLVG
ncbi:hypothetical protein [Methanobacterium aggregans]|uniref:hypothetical protein n=1 Tax=Methanobacterium aggregans TaxID=1615586 RepID=UPI00320ED270